MSLSLQSEYSSDLDRITGRLRAAHARGEFGTEPSISELAIQIESRLARQLRTAQNAEQADILDTWFLSLELRKRLGCDESPADRPPHIHSRECGQPERPACGCQAMEAEGYPLPGKPVPHPSGGFMWTAPMDHDSQDCGTAVGAMTELPGGSDFYAEGWEC